MRIKSILSRFARRSDGVASIEAAFIVPIFFAIIMSTFEVGYVFFREANVEQEMSEAAREIKVGRAFTKDFAAPGTDGDACPFGTDDALGQPCPCTNGRECFFVDACARVEPFLRGPCRDQLSVEVVRYGTFADIPGDAFAPECPSDEGYVFKDNLYDPGAPNDIVLLRACFLMETFSPILGAIDRDTEGDGRRRVVSIQLHRNEPYDPDEEDA